MPWTRRSSAWKLGWPPMTAIIQAPTEKLQRLAELREQDRRAFDTRAIWRRKARPDQLLPDGDWRVTYFQGGRGAGKTRASAQGLAELIQSTPEPCDWGIVAPTYRRSEEHTSELQSL